MKSLVISILMILLLAGLFYPVGVKAQTDPDIAQLEIAFWPDYDRHAILVIYRVHLAADTFLPAQIHLPIPLEIGEPFAVAWQDENGQLLVADYVSETQGDWQIITLTSGGLAAQLEYYMDYEVSETARSFTFSWPDGFAVEDLSYEVQEPTGAEDLVISPPPDRSVTGSEGLVYHLADLGPVSIDASINIEFRYLNPTEQLSIDVIGAPSTLPQTSPIVAQGGTPDILQIMPWLLGGLVICLVAIGGYYYFQSRREPVVVKRKRRPRPSRKASSRKEELVDSSVVYCHQCGTQASVSDHYCRHCGVPLRR
jgi:hypothetical protein